MELAIDTASEMASVSLSAEGSLVAEITWRCQRNHTVELLPTIERLLAMVGMARSEISAVFACTGPGMYTGLRVGVSAAKGLSRSLGVPLLGIGRLELDAYAHAAFPGAILAIHKAGRGDLAWATYAGSPWRELTPPRLSRSDDLAAAIDRPTLLTGELDEALTESIRRGTRHDVAAPPRAAQVRRAAALSELGWQRLASGDPADPASLVPIYLRPPAIGPQQPSR